MLCAIFISAQTQAHGGRLNSSGCHNDNKNGGYHCHRSSSSSYSKNSSSSYTGNKANKTEQLSNTTSKGTPPPLTLIFNRDVYTAQIYLQLLGYDVGLPDGLSGPKTREAIEEFQSRYYLQVTGTVSKALITSLRNKIQEKLNN